MTTSSPLSEIISPQSQHRYRPRSSTMSTSIDSVLAAQPKNDSPGSSSSSIADILDLRDDEGWEDVQPEEEEDLHVVGLLNDGTVFPTVSALLENYKTKHNYDLMAIRRELGWPALLLSAQSLSNLTFPRPRLLRHHSAGQLHPHLRQRRQRTSQTTECPRLRRREIPPARPRR